MLAVVVLTGFELDASAAAPDSSSQSLIDTHCVSCHGDSKAEADLQLDGFAAKHWDDYDLLDDMVTRIADGEMPPDDAKKPLPDSERASLVGALKKRLAELDKAQLPGEYKKLTAQEYNNTLIDLFGTPVHKLRDLPFDSEHDLKKVGEHQVVTSYAVKQYYDAARAYLDRHILVDMPPIREIRYSQADTPKEWVHTARFNKTPVGPIVGSGNQPRFMLRNPVSSHAEEGEYELTFQWYAFWVPGGKHRYNPENEYRAATPVSIPLMNVGGDLEVLNAVQRRAKDGDGYRVRYDEPIRLRLNKELKFINFGMETTFQKKSLYDHRWEFVGKYAELFKDDKPEPNKKETKEEAAARRERDRNADKMHIIITGVTIRGPLNKQEPEFHQVIFAELKRDDDFEAVVPVLAKQAQRLFRRPVADDVLANYIAIARHEYDETQNTYAAVKASLNAMLCSPHFVFKYEGGQTQLDDYMIASRLSYFLHNGPPDDELLKLAAQGKLKDPAIRRQQALRLLANREKSERFTRNFTHQWLGLDQFGQFTPNEAYIQASHYSKLKPSIEEEPLAFFNEVLFNNLSALNFIDSDFVVWDRQLDSLCQTEGARVYRPREATSGFLKLELTKNEGRKRGGLVTMPAIMSLTTDGENQQPILRGVWIARHLLGMEIDPPATVPAIEINLENVSKPREILAKHKADQSCYVCHVKFDYMGLAMENYDVLGRYKDKYVHPVQNEKGRFELVTKDAIDSLSQTPSGDAMPGVEGLKVHLMDRKETVMRHLAETLCEYALGREVRYRDRDQLAALLKQMRASEYRLQDAVLALIEAESFAKR